MNKYTKMYGWIFEAFGNEEFSLNEFRATFPSTQHAKVIHDLIHLGYLERINRGRYKTISPERFVSGMVKRNLEKEDILKQVTREYAYCDKDAVVIWTDGAYWTGFTRGFKPIHVKVMQRDLKYWKNFFEKNDAEFAIIGEKRTLFGLMYILHPTSSLEMVIKDDLPVIPLKRVVDFCKKNVLLYKPALEYLDKKYGLKIIEEYEYL